MGSKLDKEGARAVTTAEGKALAERFGAGFIEVSSKTRENVKTPFVETVNAVVASPELMNPKLIRTRREGAVNVDQAPDGGSGGGMCAC